MGNKRPAVSATRLLTRVERDAIGNPNRKIGCLSWLLLVVGGWLISTFIFVAVCTRLQYTSPLESPWFMVVILTIWIGVSVALSRWQKAQAARKQALRLDGVADDIAEIFTFAATEAIQVKEFEDEGSSYFLRLTDGQVLFLSGQYLYDYEESKRFPCVDFDIVRRSRLDFVIEVVCRGAYIAPSKILKPFRVEQFEKDKVPEDMTYVNVAWDEIEDAYS